MPLSVLVGVLGGCVAEHDVFEEPRLPSEYDDVVMLDGHRPERV